MKNVEDLYPLSPTQQGMLFHSLLDPGSGVYVEQLSASLRGDLDLPAFERAWQGVIDRHPVLRTAFVWERKERPLQVVRQQVSLPLEQEDWRGLPADEQRHRLDSWRRADRQRGFVFTRAPLMRLALLRLADDTYQLVWSSHHILLDGWSMPLVIKEVFACYEAHRRGQRFQAPRSRPYRDYIKWLQQQDMAGAEAYWRERLKGFTAPIRLFGDRPANSSPAASDASDASSHEHQQFQLSPEATGRLQEMARRHQLTLNTVVQGAWALLLSRYSGESDVVFGVTVSGRPGALAGVEQMVGLFINTLPLRVEVDEGKELVEWLREIHRGQVEMGEYEYSPLVEVQGWSEVRRGEPLFETILVFENYPVDEASQRAAGSVEIGDVETLENSNYEVTLGVAPGKSLGLKISYRKGETKESAVRRMLGHLGMLLEGMAKGPRQRLAEIEMLTEAERRQLLFEWNDTAADFPTHLCAHHLFEAQVARTPDAVAVVFNEQQLTYRELNTRANQLAQHLLNLGLGAEARVGVLLERSPEMVIALLATFKAGGAYLPLDASLPHERIRFILADAQAQVLISVRALAEGLLSAAADAPAPHRILLDAEVLTPREDVLENAGTEVGPGQVAYLIYTSGSTGTPKAVMVEHRNLVNTLLGALDEFGWHDSDLMPCLASVAFDISLFETLMPLVSGGRVMVVGREQLLEVDELVGRLREVTVLHGVPSLMRQIVGRLKGAGERGRAVLGEKVRQVYVGGDVVSAELITQIREVFAGARVRVLYGPTEAAIICGSHEVGGRGRGQMIGRGMRNVRLSVRDGLGRLAPVGVSGEVWIGGRGVTRGYWGREGLTAERFVPDGEGVRWYRSGDVGRWGEEGELEYVGRADGQVKVRGHRVELGEVEGALRGLEGVAEAVVVAREEDGEKHLVAYVVKSEPSTSVSQLHDDLRERLPSYALPQAFVFMESLPLSAAGKVDRRQLPEPGVVRAELSNAYVKPETEIEQVIASAWEETLKVEAVGRHDNLFELGANSLLMMSVNGKLREVLGQDILMVDMFKYPTVSSLARHLSREEPGENAYQKVQERIEKQKAAFKHLKQRAERER